MAQIDGLMRHISAAHTPLPGGRLPFLLGAAQVGWITPQAADLLTTMGCLRTQAGIMLPRAAALPDLAARLAEAGELRLRHEAFDVRAAPDTTPLTTIDRGALPWFGIQAEGVHVNGLVRRPDGLHLWIARRARSKKLDPGKLDHIVAGGIPAGLTPAETLVKEAAEEAGLDPALAATARPVGIIAYAMLRAEGLRRDRLHCYDLDVPDSVRPAPHDDEVESFELWPIARVLEAVRDTDDVKFNVNLVLIDLFLRTGEIDPTSTAGMALRRALTSG